MLNGCEDILFQHFNGLLLTNLVIFVTNISGNRKSWRYWHANQVHLCTVGTFSSQFITHLSITFGLTVAEAIDSFLVLHNGF